LNSRKGFDTFRKFPKLWDFCTKCGEHAIERIFVALTNEEQDDSCILIFS
jgi:hypothetical protein